MYCNFASDTTPDLYALNSFVYISSTFNAGGHDLVYRYIFTQKEIRELMHDSVSFIACSYLLMIFSNYKAFAGAFCSLIIPLLHIQPAASY